MKITFLNPVGTIGGAERILLMMMKSAIEAGHNVSLVLLDDGMLRERAVGLGVRATVVSLPERLSKWGDTQSRSLGKLAALLHTVFGLASRAMSARMVAKKLQTAIRDTEPDCIYSNGLKMHLLTGLSRFGNIPIFWHIHDYYSHRPMVARFLRFAKSKRAHAVAISQSVADDFVAVLPKVPVTVVLNAVDTHRFAPSVESTPNQGELLDDLAQLARSPENVVRIGLIATYANWKGHKLFLRAFHKASLSVPNLRGYIIGGPIYQTQGSQVTRQELVEEATRLGIVDRMGFIPFQPDPVSIYQALDVVVHASTRPEPFGLTIVEAMSCAKPVIVASAGGATELFEHGMNAWGFEPEGEESLAKAMAHLAIEPELRARLGKEARQHALVCFDQGKFAKDWLATVNDWVNC